MNHSFYIEEKRARFKQKIADLRRILRFVRDLRGPVIQARGDPFQDIA
jgi:hypothetical protein